MTSLTKNLIGFDAFLKSHYQSSDFSSKYEGESLLFESINYSLFNGGKRFRPMLSLATAEIFKLYPQNIYPYAASIESIHTYSLIHDDLPCMDNDDYRRGKLTNHKVFKEDIALLAGDALLSEAFAIVAKYYNYNGNKGLKLVSLLAGCIGPQGMVAGQALDLRSQNSNTQLMDKIHLLKTGQLIKAATVGVGIIAGASVEQLSALSKFSLNLGAAFQLADDIHDAAEGEGATDEASMVNVLGLAGVKKMLSEKTNKCYTILDSLNNNCESLRKLVEYNLNRKI